MLVTDPHGQKKGPSSSAVVFVIAGPWRQTLGDTHRALSLTSSEQCYFLGFRVKVISIFGGFFKPAGFLSSVSGPPISPQVTVEETLIQVKTIKYGIFQGSYPFLQLTV